MPNPEKGAESADQAKAKEAPKKGPEAAVFDKIMQKTGIDPNQIKPEHRAEFMRILAGVDFAHPEKLDEDPRIYDLAARQLEAWGYKKTDIHRKDLVLDTEQDKEAARLMELLRRGNMPTEKYSSNVGIHQFTTEMRDGKLVYTKSRTDTVVSQIENFLRIVGDTPATSVTEVGMLRALYHDYVRRKVDMDKVAQNVNELGLTEFFQPQMEGGKVVTITEKIDDVRSGAMLSDLLRLQAESPFLQGLDIGEALAMATQMIEYVHQNSNRGIGELLGEDIVIQVKDGKIVGARLALPDMKYEDGVEEVTQKAYDLLDFCFSVGTAGMQKGGQIQAEFNIRTVLSNYKDPIVKAKVKELAHQALPERSMHNNARLGFDRVENKEKAYGIIGQLVLQYLG